jgi:two-component system, response regulator, stage 0 sporulation protein F
MSQILLIEDQANQRLLYEQELSDEGYDVVVASNGRDGLKKFDLHRPQLVIIDILLPDINGIEVMEQLIAADPNVPIIVHSAYSSPSHDFVTWFARAYVVKSGDLDELKKEVQKALAGTPVVETQDRSGLVSAS